MTSESFIHALLLFFSLFLKISRWVPLNLRPVNKEHLAKYSPCKCPIMTSHLLKGDVPLDSTVYGLCSLCPKQGI